MPSGRIKALSKDVLYYGAGNMLYSLVQLVAMPMILRDMPMKEVANWNILLPTGVLLSAIVTFGMDSAIARFMIGTEGMRKKVIFSTGFYFVLALAFIVSAALWFLSSQVAHTINIAADYLASYWILLCWLPGVVIAQFFQNWFKYTFQRSRFMCVIALQSAVYFAVVLYLKSSHRIDLQNVMTASLISIWLPALLGLSFLRKMLVFKADSALLTEMVVYGLPFLVMAFGFNMIFSFDKYILSRYVSSEEFAIYSQSFRIAAIFSMIVSSFNFAFGPFSLSLFDKEDASGTFASVRTYYLLVICAAGVLFISAGKVIIFLLAGRNYVDGYTFLPFFILGYILYGLFSFAQLGMIQSKKSYLVLYVLLLGIVVTAGLDMLLIPFIKGYGTALGFAVGNMAMVLAANFMSGKLFKIDYNIFKDVLLICFFIGVGSLFTVTLTTCGMYTESFIKITAGALIYGIILLSPFFRIERDLFRRALSGIGGQR